MIIIIIFLQLLKFDYFNLFLGNLYYHNKINNITTWTRPSDEGLFIFSYKITINNNRNELRHNE